MKNLKNLTPLTKSKRLLIALVMLLSGPTAFAQFQNIPTWLRESYYWPLEPDGFGKGISLTSMSEGVNQNFLMAESLQNVGSLTTLRSYRDRGGAGNNAAYGQRVVTSRVVASQVYGGVGFGGPGQPPLYRQVGAHGWFYQYGLAFWIRLSAEDTLLPSSPSAAKESRVFNYGDDAIKVTLVHVSQNAFMNGNATYQIVIENNFGLGGSRRVQFPLTYNGQQNGNLALYGSRWVHIAIFYENKKLYLFLDGTLASTFDYLIIPSRASNGIGNPTTIAANDSLHIAGYQSGVGARTRIGDAGLVVNDLFFGFMRRSTYLTTDSAITANYTSLATQLYDYCKQFPSQFNITQDISTLRSTPVKLRVEYPNPHNPTQRYYQFFPQISPSQGGSANVNLSATPTTTRYDSIVLPSPDSVAYFGVRQFALVKQDPVSGCYAIGRGDLRGLNCPPTPTGLVAERVGNTYILRGTRAIAGVDSIRWFVGDYNAEQTLAQGTDTIIPFDPTDSVYFDARVYIGDCNYAYDIPNNLPGSSTSITPVASRRLSLYPNPSKGNLILDVELTGTAEVQVTNLVGQAMYTVEVSGTRPTLDLSHLPNGLYALHLNDGKTLWTGKVLLAR